MNNDLDKIEEDLKKKDEPKKKVKVSGKSVFKLKEIIQKKSEDLKEEDGSSDQAVDGNNRRGDIQT